MQKCPLPPPTLGTIKLSSWFTRLLVPSWNLLNRWLVLGLSGGIQLTVIINRLGLAKDAFLLDSLCHHVTL